MTTITQVITALPTAPDPYTMTKVEFSAAGAASVLAQKAMTPELNTWAGQVNTVKGEMVAHVAATAADAISTAADAIATAADRVQTGLDRTAAAASAASAAAIAGAFVGTSTTSLTIGSGSKTFTTQTGEQYTSGIWMTAVSQADPSNYMFGQVTSYSGTTLILNVTFTGGSGTHADWNLSLAGPKGDIGPDGWPIAAAGGTVDAITANYTPDVTLADQTKVAVVCAGANTSTTPTFAPDGLTAHTITMSGGQPLSAGSIPGAGFVALLVYNAAGTRWELINPSANPTAALGASVVLLSEIVVPVGSPVATVTFDGTFDSTYELYEMHVLDAKSDTNNARLEIRVKIGGTFQVLNTLYAAATAGTYTSDANGTIIGDMGYAVSTAQTACFVARLFKPSQTNVGKFIHFLGAQYGGGSSIVDARLVDGNNAAVTGLRFQGSAGNISGTFRLYGYKKA